MSERVDAREANRLTDDDRKAIENHITAWLEGRRHAMSDRQWSVLAAAEHEQLRQSAYRAIGCSVHDLRDVELEEVDAMVLSAALMLCLVSGNHAASPSQICPNCNQRGGI